MRVLWPSSLRNSSSTNKEASYCPSFLVVLLPGPTIQGHQGKGGEQSLLKGPPAAYHLIHSGKEETDTIDGQVRPSPSNHPAWASSLPFSLHHSIKFGWYLRSPRGHCGGTQICNTAIQRKWPHWGSSNITQRRLDISKEYKREEEERKEPDRS